MVKLTPIVRISIGLALLTISILLAADAIFGLTRARLEAALETRVSFTENLAIQLSVLVRERDLDSITTTLRALKKRNPEVVSIALRGGKGSTDVTVGDHERHWAGVTEEISTPTHVQVTLFDGARPWGKLKVGFTPLGPSGFSQILAHPAVRLVFFTGIISFLAYLIFLRRTLAHLDPSSVIPARVKQALNVLSEGVVLMDQTGRIVLANTAFEKRVAAPTSSLLGRKLSDLDWTVPGSTQAAPSLPWSAVLGDGKSHTGVAMSLSISEDNTRTFVVNASPILDDRGNTRGVLSTFDDVTELEEKNEELKRMLKMLDASRGEVRRQNQKLQVLATRDTLTGCLNRRSFFERLELEVKNARQDDLPLTCIMADIDHFKPINDTYGHATGDRIIREIADALRMGLRSVDLLGRYGGEEFCIVLPGVNAEKSKQIAERLRSLVATTFSRSRSTQLDRPVTMSFGVSTLHKGLLDSSQLVDHADRALYEAKNSGRNCVRFWGDTQENNVAYG